MCTKHTKLVIICSVFFGLSSLILLIFPKLDLIISDVFYLAPQGFIYKNNRMVQSIFGSIPIILGLILTFCILHLIYVLIKSKGIKALVLAGSFFLLLSTVIVPGFIVNTVLKNHVGRARPRQIEQFGQQLRFTPIFVMSDECKSNCSFPSGHAAMGFQVSAIAYVAPAYFTFLYMGGIFLGIIVGIARILAGGHFTSDVVAAGFILITMNHLLYLLWCFIKTKVFDSLISCRK